MDASVMCRIDLGSACKALADVPTLQHLAFTAAAGSSTMMGFYTKADFMLLSNLQLTYLALKDILYSSDICESSLSLPFHAMRLCRPQSWPLSKAV